MQSMYLGDAAVCYKKVDPAEALKLWQTSGDLLVDAGKFARAAKTFQVGHGLNKCVVMIRAFYICILLSLPVFQRIETHFVCCDIDTIDLLTLQFIRIWGS